MAYYFNFDVFCYLSLLVFSKVDCKISVLSEQIQNFRLGDAKVEKVNIAVTQNICTVNLSILQVKCVWDSSFSPCLDSQVSLEWLGQLIKPLSVCT